ncbi:MAG: hypothetical protein ABIA04_02915 [Pseudomonadota bacterium]
MLKLNFCKPIMIFVFLGLLAFSNLCIASDGPLTEEELLLFEIEVIRSDLSLNFHNASAVDFHRGITRLCELAHESSIESVYKSATQVLAEVSNVYSNTFGIINEYRLDRYSGPEDFSLLRLAEIDFVLIKNAHQIYLAMDAIYDLISLAEAAFESAEYAQIRELIAKLFQVKPIYFRVWLEQIFPELREEEADQLDTDANIVKLINRLKEAAIESENLEFKLKTMEFFHSISRHPDYSLLKKKHALEAEADIIRSLINEGNIEHLFENTYIKLTTRQRIFQLIALVFASADGEGRTQTLAWVIERAKNPRNQTEKWDQRCAINTLSILGSQHLEGSENSDINWAFYHLKQDPLIENEVAMAEKRMDAIVRERFERSRPPADPNFSLEDIPLFFTSPAAIDLKPETRANIRSDGANPEATVLIPREKTDKAKERTGKKVNIIKRK